MSGKELAAAVERVTEAVAVNCACGACVRFADLRVVLAALAEATERAERAEAVADRLYVAVEEQAQRSVKGGTQ